MHPVSKKRLVARPLRGRRNPTSKSPIFTNVSLKEASLMVRAGCEIVCMSVGRGADAVHQESGSRRSRRYSCCRVVIV